MADDNLHLYFLLFTSIIFAGSGISENCNQQLICRWRKVKHTEVNLTEVKPFNEDGDFFHLLGSTCETYANFSMHPEKSKNINDRERPYHHRLVHLSAHCMKTLSIKKSDTVVKNGLYIRGFCNDTEQQLLSSNPPTSLSLWSTKGFFIYSCRNSDAAERPDKNKQEKEDEEKQDKILHVVFGILLAVSIVLNLILLMRICLPRAMQETKTKGSLTGSRMKGYENEQHEGHYEEFTDPGKGVGLSTIACGNSQ